MLSVETNFLKTLELSPSFAPISEFRPGREFIWALAAFKCSAAQANLKMKALEHAKAGAIIQAAREVMIGRWDDLFVLDPALAVPSEYPHMINNIIAARAVQILHPEPVLYLNSQVIDPELDVNMNQRELECLCASIQIGCLKGLAQLSAALEDRLTETGGEKTELYQEKQMTDYDSTCLFNAAEALSLISLQIASKDQLTFSSKLIKYLSLNTGLPLRLADHTAGSMKTLAALDSCSSLLRSLLFDLLYNARISHHLVDGSTRSALKESSSSAGLEEIRGKLQVCDLAIALAAQNEAAERKVILPVAGYMLLDAIKRLYEAVL